MATSSSTKKAARLAQKGKGQKIRFQGGTLFPMAVAIVIVLGLALVVYARESRPATAGSPEIDDHWHHSYGFSICGEWVQFEGDGEGRDSEGRPTNIRYARSGVHSHDDGLIHWHPFTSLAIGQRARLGVFLDVYGVDVSADRIEFPEDQRLALPFNNDTGVLDVDDDQCELTDDDGNVTTEDAVITARVWENISDTDEGRRVIADFDGIRLDQDAMVVVIAFEPEDADIEMPPWTTDFTENAANDSGQLAPDDLFPGADVSDDGDVTVGGEDLDEGDVGPDVGDEPAGDDDTTDEPATGDDATDGDEPATTDS